MTKKTVPNHKVSGFSNSQIHPQTPQFEPGSILLNGVFIMLNKDYDIIIFPFTLQFYFFGLIKQRLVCTNIFSIRPKDSWNVYFSYFL